MIDILYSIGFVCQFWHFTEVSLMEKMDWRMTLYFVQRLMKWRTSNQSVHTLTPNHPNLSSTS